MRKYKLSILSLLLCVMLFTACGSESELLGSWKGNFDVTEMVKEFYVPALTASDKTMADYIQMEDLQAELTFVFDEEKAAISMDDASKEALRGKIESALTNTYLAYMQAKADKANMTLTALYSVNATTQEEALAKFLEDMKIEQVVDAIAGAFAVSGTYGYDADVITIVYEDNTWETMKYTLKDNALTISIANGEQEIPVICEKQQ